MTRKSRVLNMVRTVALVVVASMIGSLSLETAAYAQSSADVQARIRRLERDLRDLQAETFRRSPEGTSGAALPPPDPEPAAEPSRAIPDLGPMMRRVDELETSVTRLTGQMEELGYKLDQITQQQERLQKQMEFDASQRANAQLAGAPPPAASDQMASLAPAPADNLPGAAAPQPSTPGVLGQIPAGSTLPTPAPVADPKRDFDTAMNLLSRAQYDDASQSFRKFAEAYPADERASAALYWTGDIAYSAKKDYAGAARDFAELLKRYPTAPRAPDSMLKLGLSLFELGQMNEGCAALAALPAKYPQASPAITTRARNERRDAMCR